MIHEIGIELQAHLRARGCPFAVVDRESMKTSSWARERVVIEHDEDGDSFSNVVSQHKNPKHRMTRRIGAKLTIYAQSSKSGALEFEHRRRAEHVLDLVLGAMVEVAVARKNAWAPTRGRFVQPVDLEDSEKFGGVVYELAFTFDRAVHEQTWAGDIQPEMTLGANGIRSTTRVSLAGADDDGNPITIPATAETACGP